jgi:carbon-monoxide dehydrogenase large subunit
VVEQLATPAHPPLAIDVVRHVGEPVAVVVARDRASAVDALSAIEVRYEPLPPVVDMEEALAADAPTLHPGLASNAAYSWVFDSAEAGTGADVRDAVAAADLTLTRRFVHQRLLPAFLEPRSVVVDPGPSQWTIWSSTQVPHLLRVMLALITGAPEHKIRVIAPDVGGGFGGKVQVSAEELITFLAADRVGRPVKFTETRAESMLCGPHGRDVIQDVTLSARRDGTLTGISVRLLANLGAYMGLVGPGAPILGALMYCGSYRFAAYRFECTGVFTTTAVTGSYRGAGRAEATYAVERMIDELAAELDMDPIELRRRNWIERFPFTTVTGLTYDSGDHAATTNRALELFGYDELRAEQRRRRAAGDPVQLGIGASTYTEMCGPGPSRVLGALGYALGGWEYAAIRVLPTGKVEVVAGISTHRQGHETTWSQIVADLLGVDFDDVEIIHGDTRVVPKGVDTYGSRSVVVAAVAMALACDKVREKGLLVAAHLLGRSPDELEFSGGAFRVRDKPDEARTLADCALAVFTAHELPDGMEPTLDSEATFDPPAFSFPHGTHLCAVEVDTRTGRVAVRSYVCVDDVGRVINPLIVEGQVHGSVVQGIAQALFENAVYQADGMLLTDSFAGYVLPTSADVPTLVTDRTETPATTHPLGAKGVGDTGAIAAPAAVVNAIVDALRPYGVTDVPMPCTPYRVWSALTGAQP